MAVIPESSVTPTLNATPDSRFATSFLSTKYRDRAVNGEALMDKSSGELFIKRPSDGKVISFFQNKKLINELMFNLRVLLLSSTSFKYPSSDNNAFYVSTNYDLIAINNETLYDLTTDNVNISGTPYDINKLSFNVSANSNGFICRNSTRDVDKPIIEFLTQQYDSLFKDYSGNNANYVEEHGKFTSIANWEGSNAILTYDITTTLNGVETTYSNISECIRMNDDMVILFPSTINSFDSAVITIKSINYDKLHFMINHKDEFGNIFTESYTKFLYSDSRIEVAEFNISHFIDNANDFITLGNENIVVFIDIPHMNMYMTRMDSLFEVPDLPSTIEISETQPEFACIWFKPKS